MKLLNTLIDFIGIKLPVTVTIKTKRPSKKWDALYLPVYDRKTGKLKSHKITICGYASRPFSTLLAHELIHAAQEEESKTEIHGTYFKYLAQKIEDEFKIADIYIADLDLN